MMMECTDDTECSICKEEGLDAGEEEEQRIEGERIQSDMQLMTGFVSQATSCSAKAVLNEWLTRHDTNR
jgi:hypothetical protein